jgi:imidazolonepropionase-like amidohydrolase
VKLIIFGGYDAERCAALLKEHQVPVIIAGVYRLPRRRGDDYDAPYTLAERLRKAGVRFCISGSGGMFRAANVRNLPYHAATAAAYGLPRDEALRAITLSPAEILGVADRVGSLEVGKDATLIVTDGDPLETATHVEAAFIQGRLVDLSDRHKNLWKKYRQKYPQQNQP